MRPLCFNDEAEWDACQEIIYKSGAYVSCGDFEDISNWFLLLIQCFTAFGSIFGDEISDHIYDKNELYNSK